MPSSSARCAQLPRAADKVPFYVALKKFRDYLNGVIPHIDESECVFADPKSKNCYGNLFFTFNFPEMEGAVLELFLEREITQRNAN